MAQTEKRKREYMQEYMRTYQRPHPRNHNLYSQRKSEGLCVDCGKQARPGMTQCQQCYEQQRIRLKRNRQVRKRKAVQYLGGKCFDCGLQTDFMSVYDFHHKDADTKEAGITASLSNYRSWEMVQAELDKCILLCANCHRIQHEREENGIH